MWKGINGDIAGTLDSQYYRGCGSRGGREREIVYLVNDESIINRKRATASDEHERTVQLSGQYARQTGSPYRGGTEVSKPVMMSDRKGHNGISTDGTATTLAAEEKERPVVACGYDSYNQTTTGEVSQTLKSQKGGDDAPRAVIKELPATEGGDAMTSVVRRLTPLE